MRCCLLLKMSWLRLVVLPIYWMKYAVISCISRMVSLFGER